MAKNATPAKVAGHGRALARASSCRAASGTRPTRRRWNSSETEGLTPYTTVDDPDLIAGQGTLGLEIMEQFPEVELLVVPIGGGGLISGISMAVKSFNPGIRVIGVESSGAPAMKRSVAQGSRVTLDTVDCVIDGLVVKRVGGNTCSVVSRFVDEIVTLPDEQIFEAVLWLMTRAKWDRGRGGEPALGALFTREVRRARGDEEFGGCSAREFLRKKSCRNVLELRSRSGHRAGLRNAECRITIVVSDKYASESELSLGRAQTHGLRRNLRDRRTDLADALPHGEACGDRPGLSATSPAGATPASMPRVSCRPNRNRFALSAPPSRKVIAALSALLG